MSKYPPPPPYSGTLEEYPAVEFDMEGLLRW